MSQLSGATGPGDKNPKRLGHSMMQAALPTLETDSLHSNFQSQVSFDEVNIDPKRALFPGFSNKTLAGTGSGSRNGNGSGGKKNNRRSILAQSTIRTMNTLKKAKLNPSFITKTKRFQDLVKWSFEVIDVDKSGRIDKTELYSGLVLIHLQLAAYVGPAACRPASRERVDAMFDILDEDNNGSLEMKEFEVVMSMLCSNILTRVIMQLGVTLMIVPIVAEQFLDVCSHIWKVVRAVLHEIDEMEELTEMAYQGLAFILDLIIPSGIKIAALKAYQKADEFIPDDTYDTLPLTIISCVLSMLLVPWTLYRIDEFFHKLAKRRKEKARKRNN